MRPKSHCPFVLLAAWQAVSIALAQSPSGPALLPPPDPSWRVGVEAYSVPWYPPPEAIPVEEALPIPGDAFSTEGAFGPNVVRIDPETDWRRPQYWLSSDSWDTSLELGLNGSAGTSESLSLRTGGSMKRTSAYSRLRLSSHYNRTTRGGTATQNNANFDARNDWLLDENSPWMLYATGNVFCDEFQEFDLQTNANTGVGYRLINDPDAELIGRVGGGASRKFGGPDQRWVPESLLGLEYNHRISKAQKFYAKLDYFPEWDEVGEFRLVADMGWEVALAEPANMSLKLAASDRYDSSPTGPGAHLVNYSVLLMVKL